MKKAKISATISIEQLTDMANLGKRRIYQLAEEDKIPKPTNGKFPMPETITALCKYYQRDSEELKRERLALVRVNRQVKELELSVSEKHTIAKPLAERTIVGFARSYHALVRTQTERYSPAARKEKLEQLKISDAALVEFEAWDREQSTKVIDRIETEAARIATAAPGQLEQPT